MSKDKIYDIISPTMNTYLKLKMPWAASLTLFDMGFFEQSVIVIGGGGMMIPPHHNFVVIALMLMKFGTGMKLDVFYTMETKNITSLLLCNYDIMTCTLADM